MKTDKNKTYHERYQQFYNSSEWKTLRNYKFGQADGLCENCKKNGIVRAAREIHHVIPIDEDWSKRLDYENLIALCPDCHNEQHKRISQLQKFLKEWENM